MAKGKSIYQRQLDDMRSARNKDIMKRRKKGETLEQIAAAIGITHQRVGQIINKAKEKSA